MPSKYDEAVQTIMAEKAANPSLAISELCKQQGIPQTYYYVRLRALKKATKKTGLKGPLRALQGPQNTPITRKPPPAPPTQDRPSTDVITVKVSIDEVVKAKRRNRDLVIPIDKILNACPPEILKLYHIRFSEIAHKKGSLVDDEAEGLTPPNKKVSPFNASGE